MLVLLPPSETKVGGGTGRPLNLDTLSYGALMPLRRKLADALVDLSSGEEAATRALGLGKNQSGELERNVALWESPTVPAIERYTGVLFEAMGIASLSTAERRRALSRLAVGSALFGAVRASDPIPAYRLSAGSRLPGFGTLRSVWRPALSAALADATAGDLVVDLRSGAYRALGPVPGAITATVLTEKPDGTRAVVSHFNKHHKGLLARALATTRRKPRDIHAVAAVASDVGLVVEVPAADEIVILT